ncbi:MAG: hypothetical protein IT236_04405 [Bacteroidia bacterium]|nr:hypothetical protein [Bacteroidia bacterium]
MYLKAGKLISVTLGFILLTVLSQTGGIVLLLALATQKWLTGISKTNYVLTTLKCLWFVFIYALCTFLIVPLIARPLGRVPLPMRETGHLKPHNLLSCLLNRNYVHKDLEQTAFRVAAQMHQQFPGSTLNYLDAGFPFINGFPLLPHLSHNDGKKLDLSFYYRDAKTNQVLNSNGSFTGYGICEEPLPGEINTAQGCSKNGYWQYSLLKKIVSQKNKEALTFDEQRTAAMVNFFVADENIGKLFIEPHLKTRLKLSSQKIKFHGCRAVRHDDHLHVQLK